MRPIWRVYFPQFIFTVKLPLMPGTIIRKRYGLMLAAFAVLSRPQDPCGETGAMAEKLSAFAVTPVFMQSKKAIDSASRDNHEHGMEFGKTKDGKDTASRVRGSGLKNAFAINVNFPGIFADMHNHPANTAPSAGDIYNLISINRQHPLFNCRFTILQSGIVYAIAIIDPEKSRNFAEKYPSEQTNGFSPRFPSALFNEFADLKSYLINIQAIDRTTADEMATAFMLDKYLSGIALFRLYKGKFLRVYVTESAEDAAVKSYHLNICTTPLPMSLRIASGPSS